MQTALSSEQLVVLVVDDQPIIGESVRRLLHGVSDARVEVCTRALDAVARAKVLRPSVILQDLVMPDGDGMDLVARYRAEQTLADASIIVLSAEEHAATKAEAFARGADDYIVKLPAQEEFVARVLYHAQASRAKRERGHVARERLERIAQMSSELARVQDLDIMLSRILREAVALIECAAGAVFLAESGSLRVAHTIGAMRCIAGSDAGDEAASLQNVLATRRATRLPKALIVPILRGEDAPLGCIALLDGSSGDDADGQGFDHDDEQLLVYFASLAAVALERAMLVRSMILRMIAMAELRDPTETASHVARVADLSIMLYDAARSASAQPSSNTTRERDTLRIAALLHDVGKVGVSDAVLKKPGKLDDAEFAEMKRHTEIGAALFAGIRTDFDESAAAVALCHHERFDGRGYPHGLKGEAIPYFARIVAVADVFDALSSKRVYKDAWSRERITAYFAEQSGAQFDPQFAALILAHQSQAEAIRARRTD